jgi:hypothetical protein
MATTRKKPKQPPVGYADMSGSQQLAHDIISQFVDLTPSVNRIVEAPLSEAGRLHALTLFRDSLSSPGDPMRHPARALAAGQAFDEANG